MAYRQRLFSRNPDSMWKYAKLRQPPAEVLGQVN
jgi:hypothetical protein